jgi:hypothetical protein
MTPLEAALHYASLGWPVVPLHTPDEQGVCDCPKRATCKTPGKDPRTKNGLKDATTDEEVIKRWWKMWPHANIGVDLARSGLVDIAPDSVEWHAEFIARGLPPTLSFASGGGDGHEHHLYARTDDCPIYRLTETGQYDILSAGYAVMPPSRHRFGSTYTWLEPDELARLTSPPDVPPPTWSKDMLWAKQRPSSGHELPVREPGDPPVRLRGEALERWYGRVFDTNPDTGEVDRSWSLWSIAVVLLEVGCSPYFVEELLAERDVALGWDKFTDRRNADERYSAIVEKAHASQGSQRIHLNGAMPAAPVPSSERRTPQLAALGWETIDEFNASEDEDVSWTAVGIVGDGLITELDGKAKRSGKTTLLLALARAVLHGEPFFGQPTTYSPVVYLTEQSGPSFKRSLRRSGLVDGDAFHLLRWGRTVDWTWPQLIEEVLVKIDELGARVLIIDTLAQFSGVRGDDENRSGAALEVMEPLQAATVRKLGIIISRHDRKAGGVAGDSGRGSSAYAGAVDIILHLDRPEPKPGTERQRVLEGLSRFEETPDKLLVELSEGEPQTYVVMGNVEDIKTRDMRRDMLAVLPTHADDALHRTALFEQVLGREIDKARVLKDLIREGLVLIEKKAEEGKQRPREHFYQRVWGPDDD